jgi:hypothetical protein
MPNVVKYQSGGSETHSIKKGNLWFGVGGRGYGPTDTTGFYSGIEIPDGGYAFYQGSAGGFTYYTANNDDQLVALVNSATGNSFDISESLHYIAQQDGMAVMKKNKNQTVTDGLVLNLDASSLLSYPTTGSTIYDISGGGDNGTLTNGPTFNSKGYLEFDGVDDWLTVPGADTLVKGQSEISMGVLVRPTSLSFLGVVIGVPAYSCTKNIVISAFETGNLSFYNDDLITCRAVTLNSYLEVDKWTYIVGTFNGTTTSLYAIKDGTLSLVSDTLVTGSTNDFDSYNTFGLMGRGANYIGGDLASAFVYQKSLTESEILQNYYGGPIVTDDLAFYFDPGNLVSYESGSTTAYSMTGSYTGTLINDVELDPQKGGVWKFDAVDTAISYGYQVINFNPSTQPFSMGGWMRLDSDSGSGNHAVIIDIGGTSSARLYIAIDKNDLRLVVNIRPPAGTTSVPVYTPENSVSFGEWVHGMVTFNGGTIKIYQNGELSRTATGFTNYPTATYNWWSGHQDDNNHYMDGFIGPVSLYLKTLSDDEVWQNYLAQSIRFE